MTSYLNHPIETQISWPTQETIVEFGDHEILVFPPDRQHDASLHIDLQRSKITDVVGMSILSQLLSIAAWLDDTYAVLLDGWSGGRIPTRPLRDTNCYPSSIIEFWANNWPPVESFSARRSLAIYREALNMNRYYSPPYAVLGFFRIIEEQFNKKDGLRFLEEQIDKRIGSNDISQLQLRLLELPENFSAADIVRLLKIEGRHAVAHAKKDSDIDPDNIEQVRKISVVSDILRQLARSFMHQQLKLPEDSWI